VILNLLSVEDALNYGKPERDDHYYLDCGDAVKEPRLKRAEPDGIRQRAFRACDVAVHNAQSRKTNPARDKHPDDAVSAMTFDLLVGYVIRLDYQIDVPNCPGPIMNMD
jgi:hypothetical protein